MSLARTTRVKTDPELNEDVVLFQKGLCWFPPTSDDNKPSFGLALASTVQSNLMQFGYSLNPEAFESMKHASVDTILKFNNRIIEYLKEVTGGKHSYVALYPGFPKQVMDLTDAELLENAINHDLTGWMPTSIDRGMVIKSEDVKYTTLKATNQEGLVQIFTDLVSVNQSLTPEDLRVIQWFVKSGLPLKYPKEIPFKENLCTLAGIGVPGLPVKTTTDVLRIAVYLSGGDISLPKVPPANKEVHIGWGRRGMTQSVPNAERSAFKFKKFGRNQRQYILELLENSNCNPEEMILKAQRWIRLAEILHPGDYQTKYPKAFKALSAVRNSKDNTKVRSWYSQVKDAFRRNFTDGLKKLSERPGEFMRSLDFLVRKFPQNLHLVLNAFMVASRGASNKVLYEVWQHFEGRNKMVTGRKVTIKGARKPQKLPDLPALPEKVIADIQEGVKEALLEKFSKLEPLGAVYIDPELRKIPIPTNMRSVNFSLKPRIRGQRTPWDSQDKPCIRAYFHWIDEHGNLDPDLSVLFAKEDGSFEYVNYTNLRGTGAIAVHSGDIIARKGKNAEYVDINVQKALDAGYRYAEIDVRDFRGGGLHNMQGVFGIMERDHPEANMHWVPATISNAHGCESTANNTILAVIDLKTKEYVFLDVDSSGATAIQHDTKNVLEMIKYYTADPKFSVHDLLSLHALARGTTVQDIQIADTVFKYADFCDSYVKTAQYMGV